MGNLKKDEELYEYQYTTPNKKVVKELLPALKKPKGKKEGKKKIFWGRNLFIFGILFFILNIRSLFLGGLFVALLKIAVSAAAVGVGIYQTEQGKQMKERIARYNRYMKSLEGKKYASVEELSLKVAKNPKTVIKDLEYMIQNRWFLEAHLDPQKTQFMLTDQIYEQYLMSMKGQELKEEEEKKQKELENDPLQKELNKVLREGEVYVKKIHKLNDMILGDDVSQKMDKIEETLISIFDLLKRKPEKLGEIRKLMQYYLPITIKVLERYRDFENERIVSKQLEEGKNDIEESLEKIHRAFVKLREKLFQEEVLDVSTDLDVLETMMSQEGLIEDEFSIKTE